MRRGCACDQRADGTVTGLCAAHAEAARAHFKDELDELTRLRAQVYVFREFVAFLSGEEGLIGFTARLVIDAVARQSGRA